MLMLFAHTALTGILALAMAGAPTDIQPAEVENGVWVETLKLCRDNVARAEIGKNAYSDQTMLTVQLKPAATRWLAELTRSRIGQTIAIRIDGEMVSEPHVQEAIHGGSFQITSPETELLQQGRDLATTPC